MAILLVLWRLVRLVRRLVRAAAVASRAGGEEEEEGARGDGGGADEGASEGTHTAHAGYVANGGEGNGRFAVVSVFPPAHRFLVDRHRLPAMRVVVWTDARGGSLVGPRRPAGEGRRERVETWLDRVE